MKKFGASAVEPLIAALTNKNQHVRESVARLLADTGDPRAVEPLYVSLRRRDWSVVTSVYPFYLKNFMPGAELLLVRALRVWKKIKGTRQMAEDYLNCGKQGLKDAAKSWAKDH